jgi:hypothetical protein
MSTAITKNVQVGSSGTATDNFTIFQPATPDGTLRIGNGNSGITTSLLALTSAGNLGIGTTNPLAKLHLQDNAAVYIQLTDSGDAASRIGQNGTALTFGVDASNGTTERMRLDSSGNLGLGVTPSAGDVYYRKIELGKVGCGIAAGNASLSNSELTYFTGNAVLTYTGANPWTYGNAGSAGVYSIEDGTHVWRNAPSGTAGNAISFTQAMTLTGAGNLGIGTSNPLYQVMILRRVGSTITAPLLNLQSQTSGSTDGDSFILYGTQTANWAAGVDQADSNKFRIEPTTTLGAADGLTITTSGNLGIGTSAPFPAASRRGLVVRDGSGNGAELILQSTTTTNGTSDGVALVAAGSDAYVFNRISGGFIGFGTSNTERMRIDSSGNLLVGATSFTTGGISKTVLIDGVSSAGVQLRINGSLASYVYTYLSAGFRVETSSTYARVEFVPGGTGGVQLSAAGATSWTALSDENTKTDLIPITNAADKVASLRAVTGRFKTDSPEIRRAFLIAQDVQSVLPEAISPYKIKDDDTEYLGLSYTDTIPLLVAAIKEQQEMIAQQSEIITTLTARVAALESN